MHRKDVVLIKNKEEILHQSWTFFSAVIFGVYIYCFTVSDSVTIWKRVSYFNVFKSNIERLDSLVKIFGLINLLIVSTLHNNYFSNNSNNYLGDKDMICAHWI